MLYEPKPQLLENSIKSKIHTILRQSTCESSSLHIVQYSCLRISGTKQRIRKRSRFSNHSGDFYLFTNNAGEESHCWVGESIHPKQDVHSAGTSIERSKR